MTPTALTLDDGTTVPLISDHHGWTAKHDGVLIHVTAVRTSVAVSPAKARMAVDRA